ncbi:MAG: DUF1801 domain-containing protein, partial [Verrucomicrobiaceae bacterium]
MTQDAEQASGSLDPEIWLAGVEPKRRDDAARLLAIFGEVTGWEPRTWGPAGTQAGFGRYVYRYGSGHGGEGHVVGFSPRKPEISLYGLTATPGAAGLLERLGNHRMGKSCLYVKRL